MDISSDKLVGLNTKRHGYGYEKEISKEKLNLFRYKHKITSYRPIILKRKSIIYNRIETVIYTEKKMKLLIT